MNCYDRNIIESSVISSLIQGGSRAKSLCEEFGIKPEDFLYANGSEVYAKLMNGEDVPHIGPVDYWSYVPSSGNARYYIEELYALIRDSKT